MLNLLNVKHVKCLGACLGKIRVSPNMFIMFNMLTFPQPEADCEIKNKKLTFQRLESLLAAKPENVKLFRCRRANSLTFPGLGAKWDSHRGNVKLFVLEYKICFWLGKG